MTATSMNDAASKHSIEDQAQRSTAPGGYLDPARRPVTYFGKLRCLRLGMSVRVNDLVARPGSEDSIIHSTAALPVKPAAACDVSDEFLSSLSPSPLSLGRRSVASLRARVLTMAFFADASGLHGCPYQRTLGSPGSPSPCPPEAFQDFNVNVPVCPLKGFVIQSRQGPGL
ncbi:hypothetical protein CC1G_15750 [Coprinopsis cinerea okayama7|uniref:Uncharacterized protein n=1 Tax=Coprinopsis cinerea (strain Okayama-7 / 130 / ATCC MYA-4618 / FGSC 9003) TaxID=240176 RepID=D6RQJ7_COPC7|nr:hypothetical protein CC1G_15750 [Coprinopsis cinerea okayama7\|eukprot:XP_002910321.1 hypothetical protein CC1G_15750 [Coprinopsis cinerea okayama7\